MTDTLPAAAHAPGAAARWLATQQEVAERAAHDLKNTLNGVAVNLEVVRSRLARPGVQPEQVQRFAESAAQQLELLTTQVEALLAVTRAPREPADVGATAAQLLALRPGPHGNQDRHPAAFTAASGTLVRLLLAAALGRGATCDVTLDPDGRPRARCAPAGPLDSDLRELALAGGVETAHDAPPDGAPALTLIFPARGREPAEKTT